MFGPPRDREGALAVLRRAVELGVNHIDTAQYYGPDIANELICEALHPYPDDLALVSKVGAAREADGGWIPAQRPEQLRLGVEANLRSPAVERVDVVNLRLMGDEGDEPSPEVSLEEQLATMVQRCGRPYTRLTYPRRGTAMAVGIRLKFAGGTQQQYDTVHQHMDINNNPPDGLIFHSAGPIDGGWGIIDFWESTEAFDRFAQGRLMPAVGELGDRAFPGPPDRKEFPVYNFNKP